MLNVWKQILKNGICSYFGVFLNYPIKFQNLEQVRSIPNEIRAVVEQYSFELIHSWFQNYVLGLVKQATLNERNKNLPMDKALITP